MNQRFIQAVAEKDLKKVRLSISNELLLDPKGASVDEMINYALDHLPNLFEDDDNGENIHDPGLWNEDYLSDLHIKLNKNFSKEKLEHFKVVARVVLKAKIEDLNPPKKNDSSHYTRPKGTATKGRSHNNRRDLFCIAGGSLSAFIGLCVGSVPIKVTLIAAGLAGIAYGVYNLQKK